ERLMVGDRLDEALVLLEQVRKRTPSGLVGELNAEVKRINTKVAAAASTPRPQEGVPGETPAPPAPRAKRSLPDTPAPPEEAPGPAPPPPPPTPPTTRKKTTPAPPPPSTPQPPTPPVKPA